MKNMRVVVTRIGGPEVVQVLSDAAPEPKAGEVRLRVLAAGVSQADITIREGFYTNSVKTPFTLGYDCVGVVEKLGAGVQQLRVGDHVAAITVRGSHAEYICWPADDCAPIPADVDPVKAVCLLLNYMTAYQMLHRVAQIKAGDRLLVHSAAGGVGSALVQLGHLAGAELYGTASSSKLDFVRGLGATPIDYTTEDFVERVRSFVPGGVDVVFDAIGGANFSRSFETLTPRGQFVGYGFTAKVGQRFGRVDTFARLGWMFIARGGRKVAFYGIMFMKKDHADWFRADLQELLRLYQSGQIDPAVSAVLPLQQAREALALLETRKVSGKVVLTP
ncbi:MAG: zinc-binding dehydrogenase [Roseiflexaceae bacterium]|nr:zinc-binding dehydrogenase [Roseiflexaceae bacterium]